MSVKMLGWWLIPVGLLVITLGCVPYAYSAPVENAGRESSSAEVSRLGDSPGPHVQMSALPIPPEPGPGEPGPGLPPGGKKPVIAPAFARQVNYYVHGEVGPIPATSEAIRGRLRNYIKSRFGEGLREVSVLGSADVYSVNIADVRNPFGRNSEQVFDIEYLVVIQRSIPQIVIAGVCKYRKHMEGTTPGAWKPCLDHDNMTGDLAKLAGGMAGCIVGEGACKHEEDH